jgi:hypothetical protein
VAGELVGIGLRPRLVAEFSQPDAEPRFRAWREANWATLAAIPPSAWRVEYGRAGDGLYVRVRIDEGHLPPGLDSG